MNRTLIGFALLASVALCAEPEQATRVKASEPTVVTVHGSAERVEPANTRQPKKRRFRIGGLKALTGAANAGGWLLNTGDDVPSSREREFSHRSAR